jgi:hypothetical protein
MLKVDAKAEIDRLFGNLTDVVHFVGTTQVQNGQHVAFARLVFAEDMELRPWPSKLIYNRSVEVATGIQMFSIYAPGEFLEPYLTTEWGDSCGNFIEAARALGLFMIEIITPVCKRWALVVDDVVSRTAENPITPDEYVFLSNAYSAPPSPAAS